MPRCYADACSFPWGFTFRSFEHLSAEVVFKKAKEYHETIVDYLDYPEPERLMVNNFEIVKSYDGDMCKYFSYEIVGSEYNYVFQTSCLGDSEEKEVDYLEGIIGSIEFL